MKLPPDLDAALYAELVPRRPRPAPTRIRPRPVVQVNTDKASQEAIAALVDAVVPTGKPASMPGPLAAVQAQLARLPRSGPSLNVGPVPSRSPADRPSRLRQDATRPPHVHSGAFDAKAVGDLGDAHGLAISHEESVAKVLTPDQGCSDNQYMIQTENSTKTAPCGCTFQGRIYSLLGCTVIDIQTATGREQMRHAMAAQKKAK